MRGTQPPPRSRPETRLSPAAHNRETIATFARHQRGRPGHPACNRPPLFPTRRV